MKIGRQRFDRNRGAKRDRNGSASQGRQRRERTGEDLPPEQPKSSDTARAPSIHEARAAGVVVAHEREDKCVEIRLTRLQPEEGNPGGVTRLQVALRDNSEARH